MRFMEKVCLGQRVIAAMVVLFAVAGHGAAAAEAPAAIYFGGPIITYHDGPDVDAYAIAEAVGVKGGRIVAVGSRVEVENALKGTKTTLVDLKGKTLVPGFVDAHSHLAQVAILPMTANLLPPPDGEANSVKGIQEILRKHIENSSVVKKTGVAIGNGYDDSQLVPPGHPTRADLDEVSKTIPIMIIHQSGHLSVSNSKALENAGITNNPSGLMDENEHIAMLKKTLPAASKDELIAMLAPGLDLYIEQGFTTVQEGRADPSFAALAAAGAKTGGGFEVDVVAYPDLEGLQPLLADGKLPSPAPSRSYAGRFRVGGVKLVLDGSPQGKGAWFTDSYLVSPDKNRPDFGGIPNHPTDSGPKRMMIQAYRNNWQVMVHANGDAAIERFIRMVRTAQAAVPDVAAADRRTVLIHGQFMRADQIPQIKELGVFPSLFPMHTFYWGDWYVDSVTGLKRAEFLSPTKAVLDAGMKLSVHSDAPVTFPNSMRILDSAVNRTTRQKRVLGNDQVLKPIVALKAMTIWPAYQHFEEATKGSIEVGKSADFAVLSHNPLTVDKNKLVCITIAGTIKDGRWIYPTAAHPLIKQKLPPECP